METPVSPDQSIAVDLAIARADALIGKERPLNAATAREVLRDSNVGKVLIQRWLR